MSTPVQMFRFDEAVQRVRKGVSVRGRGVNGGDVQALMYPIKAGLPDLNIRFSFDRVGNGFFSPRHRHNFDQFRYCVSGTINIGKNVTLHAGECAYFPEGTFYGPQEQVGDGEVFVMQFPGPQASYFMVEPEYRAAVERLAQHGVFESGAYIRTGEDGKQIRKDGFEAGWEEHTGHPVTYSPQRYPEPIVMHPNSFQWVPDSTRPGLSIRRMGTFNEYRTSVAEWKLDPGTVLAAATLDAPQVRFITKGEVTSAGKTLSGHGCMYVPENVPTEPIESVAGAEFLVIEIPMYVASVWERARGTLATGKTQEI